MNDTWLKGAWTALVVRGGIAVIFGVIAIFWPIATAVALALLWGVWALVDGVMSLMHAFGRGASMGDRVLWVVLGAISLIAAFVAIVSPGVTAVVLTWILGLWLIARGVVELIAAFGRSPGAPRWLLVLAALLDGLLGVLFVANPGAGVLGVATFLGVVAIAWGVVLIAVAFSMRSAGKRVAAQEPRVA